MAKETSTASNNAKSVEIVALPPLKTFFSRTSMAPSQEKGQINEIRVESGKPGTQTHKEIVIYSGKEFVKGVHPNQAAFILNAISGGTGNAKSDRHLGFATWVSNVVNSNLFERMVAGLNPEKYSVIVEYTKRGGTMVWPMSELVKWCELKAAAARNSETRFPHEVTIKAPTTRTKKVAEVSVTL